MRFPFLLLFPILGLFAISLARAQGYDPMSLSSAQPSDPKDLVFTDAKRQRELPLLVYLPADTSAAPVVLFSHGLGGSRKGNPFMGEHWAARGYVAVFLQHPGSDESVWRDAPPGGRLKAMREAASLENFLARVQDVPAVLDQLAKWNAESGHDLAGRLDLARVAMTGHSFGAVTTQAIGGQATATGQSFGDERILAAIAFSPGIPQRGTPETAFAGVKLPWLLMTGTLDDSPIGGQTPESRLQVFPALSPGDKYELVLHGAEHSAFTDRALPGDKQERNPNHHRAILAIGTAFLDAYLKKDGAAKAWLQGEAVRSVLESQDRWRKK